jgi:hypothetical protein
VVDVLVTGALIYKYKETNPKKAKTFSMATLLKWIRREHAPVDVKSVA